MALDILDFILTFVLLAMLFTTGSVMVWIFWTELKLFLRERRDKKLSEQEGDV